MTDHATQLLDWYDRHGRDLPWRVKGGGAVDPYRVWLSEIMLQQTTVQAVKPYFERFTTRWPTVSALAAATGEEVMQLWAGLGYYSRARNLHACSRQIVERHGGRFPRSESALLTLPGIGAYTAAAIAAIAHGERAVVVDGNVERVITRLWRLETPLPAARPEIRRLTDSVTPDQRAGDFAQAMMDLGATICTPRKPVCALCPLNGGCRAFRAGDAERYPIKAKKAERPTRRGAAFVARRDDGAVLVQTRPPKGLLGGMTEVPGTDWQVNRLLPQSPDGAPIQAQWRLATATVQHVFTHFPLELSVFTATVPKTTAAPDGMRWLSAANVPDAAFPTVFRKVLRAGGIG